MKIFLSWSGARSLRVAEYLDEWLQCVIQSLKPWMSSKDIDKGSLWFDEISKALEDTKVGIVCLTSANINNPWILFESGALAKGLSSSRVCPLLIDLEPRDISDPLARFNHTIPNKNGMLQLVKTLNDCLGDSKLSDTTLNEVFETYWPKFEDNFEIILSETDDDVENVEKTDSEILSEVLSLSRMIIRRLDFQTNISENPSNSIFDPRRYHSMSSIDLLSNPPGTYFDSLTNRWCSIFDPSENIQSENNPDDNSDDGQS